MSVSVSVEQYCGLKPLERRKVAIVAKAPSSRLLAPFDDPDWEIWGLSDAVSYVGDERWHRWFELHDLARYQETYAWYWQWLTKDHGDRPLYIGRADDPMAGRIPSGVVYPTEAITAKFGRYFNNSVSFMLAAAIALKPDTIGLWGVDMAVDQVNNAEYSHQRPSCEYFIGLARGLGIEVIVPEESDLLKVGRLYGIEANRGVMDRKLRVRDVELATRARQAEKARRKAEAHQYVTSGALHLIDALHQVAQHDSSSVPAWLESRRKQLAEEHEQANDEAEQLKQNEWMLRGARDDLQWARQWA